jgi:hypothetical protein
MDLAASSECLPSYVVPSGTSGISVSVRWLARPTELWVNVETMQFAMESDCEAGVNISIAGVCCQIQIRPHI